MLQSLIYEFPEAIALANSSGALISFCSIGDLTGAVSSIGQADLADFAPVPGLQNIPCILSVYRASSPDKGAQMRMPDGFDFSNYRHVLLNSYYPAIQQRMQATVDGTAYEIFAVEHDSQHTMTRLVARIYTK